MDVSLPVIGNLYRLLNTSEAILKYQHKVLQSRGRYVA